MSQHLGKNISSLDRTNNPTPANERSEILAWLSPLDPRIRHQDLQAQRVEHVGDYLLQTEQFRSWCYGTCQDESGNATLFCHGDPGVGKTYTTSLVIDTLCEQARRQNAAVACFYVDFAAREQSPTNMLGSLLKQLVRGLDKVPEQVVHAFRDSEMGVGSQTPQLADVVKLFQTVSTLQNTIICIDALDECSLGDRLKLLSSLGHILRGSPRTRLFLTGRSHIRSEIEEQLGGVVTIVSITTGKGDIIRYLRSRLDEDPAPDAMNSGLEADIVHRISGTLSTIFLMASLNINGILRETTILRRRRRLSAMTGALTLGDTYGVSLERIRAQDRARSRLGMAVLMWVCHSERPLHMDELCHALAIEIGNADLGSGNVPSKGTLLGCCQGLVIMDRESSTARLIHSTLRDYLRTHPDYFVNAHSTIAETCLTYLNSQQVKDLSATPSPDVHDTPFLNYASRYWGTHAKMELSKNAKSLALQLFDQYHDHVSARLLLEQVWSSDCVKRDPSSTFTGLHCASFFGIAEIVDTLMGMKGCGINQRDCVGVTPLIWAAMYGHQDVVKLLLGQEDVDPSIPGRGDGRTALSWAKGNGHEGVVNLLLGWGDVNPDTQHRRDGQGRVQHPYADFLFQEGMRLPCRQSSSGSSQIDNEPLHSSPAPAPADNTDTSAALGPDAPPRHRASVSRDSGSCPGFVVSPRQGTHGEAEVMHQRALTDGEKALGRDHPGALHRINELGLALHQQGKYGEAEITHRRALAGREKALGRDHPDTLWSVNNLGVALQLQGKHGEAEIFHRRALAGRESVFGEDHLDTLLGVNELGLALDQQGKHDEAEIMHRRALAGREKILGRDHLDTLSSVNNLGAALHFQRKYDEAEILHRRASAGREKALGRYHLDTLLSVNNLGAALHCQRKYDEAEAMHRRALAGRENALGSDHLDTLLSVSNLGAALHFQRKYDEAEILHQRASAGREKALGRDHPDTLWSISSLGVALHSQGKYNEAEITHRRALSGREKALGRDHPDTLLSANNLGAALHHQGKHLEAEVTRQRALAGGESAPGGDRQDTLLGVGKLPVDLVPVRWGRYDELKVVHRHTLADRGDAFTRDSPDHLSAQIEGAFTRDSPDHLSAQIEGAFTRDSPDHLEETSRRDYPDPMLNVGDLYGIFYWEEKYDQAEIKHRHAVEWSKITLSPGGPAQNIPSGDYSSFSSSGRHNIMRLYNSSNTSYSQLSSTNLANIGPGLTQNNNASKYPDQVPAPYVTSASSTD
ncbi:hypothetical protein HOY80DRAFT_1038049 [Tuber brumale]|nr:hypothetical protein HOY80DRAFT_1038049 [Tuber brumale]